MRLGAYRVGWHPDADEPDDVEFSDALIYQTSSGQQMMAVGNWVSPAPLEGIDYKSLEPIGGRSTGVEHIIAAARHCLRNYTGLPPEPGMSLEGDLLRILYDTAQLPENGGPIGHDEPRRSEDAGEVRDRDPAPEQDRTTVLRGGHPGGGETQSPFTSESPSRLYGQSGQHAVGWTRQIQNIEEQRELMYTRGAPGDLLSVVDSMTNWMKAMEHYLNQQVEN